ncbi:MAG: GNAT family N-acetyltransferase [Kineosporiaceae bacterium]
MRISLQTPGEADLDEVVEALASWQVDGAPVQLHPGDLGWHWRFEAAAVAASVRVWRRGGEIAAVGFLDAPALLRMGISPRAAGDESLAAHVVDDLADPGAGVLPHGPAGVEARAGDALRARLGACGWRPDEPWTPLRHDLQRLDGAADLGLEVEVVTPNGPPELIADRVAVHRAAFAGSTLTPHAWRVMAAAPGYAQARCLVGRDATGTAVAAVTVWSAGPGRPGLVEPMGVHRDHRGRGHGRAITLAGVEAMRTLGCSSAVVATPSDNRGAVATYVAAGFRAEEPVTDFGRQG